jgi:hypothetical protein
MNHKLSAYQSSVNAAYATAAPLMLPGDVIAFEGQEFPVSQAIRSYTGCRISHVGLVASGLQLDAAGKVLTDVMLFESTIYTDPITKKKISGPQTHGLGSVLTFDYSAKDSRAWLLRLLPSERAEIDFAKFHAFIASCEIPGRVTYDIPGLFAFLWRSVPFVGAHIAQTESYRRMFCSAADVDAFENSGLQLHRDFTATSPADLIRMRLYQAPPIQILGPTCEMDKLFNTF